MPMMIEHIDAIARQKQRGVLFVEFQPSAVTAEAGTSRSAVSWQNLPIRQQVIDWLETHGIGWDMCGSFANPSRLTGYKGQIYIDLPYDLTLAAYQELQNFLENPDGSPRNPSIVFGYCPLETAMQNAAHDEPGFWDKWADGF